MKQLPRELYRTIAIDPELQRQVAIVAKSQSTSIKDFVEKLLRDGLSQYQVRVDYIPEAAREPIATITATPDPVAV